MNFPNVIIITRTNYYKHDVRRKRVPLSQRNVDSWNYDEFRSSKNYFDIGVYQRDWVQMFPPGWSSRRQAGKFAYEAIAQKCKRRGNLFARDQLVHKVREDELRYTSQILLFIECLATLSSLVQTKDLYVTIKIIVHAKSSLSRYVVNLFYLTHDIMYNNDKTWQSAN